MPTVQTATALALNLTPGPSILFILSRCLGQGRRAAVASVFGPATASVIQAFIWVVGCFRVLTDCIRSHQILWCRIFGLLGSLMTGGIAGTAGSVSGTHRASLLRSYFRGSEPSSFRYPLV